MQKIALQFPGTGTAPEISEDLSQLDPGNWVLKGWISELKSNPTPADIINIILPFIFTIAGLILFLMFILGGFTIFTSTGNEEKINKGKSMITNALVGFFVIFAAYWIIQLLEFSLGIKFL
jgi:hypothetical protein